MIQRGKTKYLALFLFIKTYRKKKPLLSLFLWCLEPNLEQNSFFIFMKSMKILSTSDILPFINQPGVGFEQNFNKFLEGLGLWVLLSQKYFFLNPAYGRQSISRPMRIVAQMPQEGGPRIPQNPIFLKNGKNHPKRKNSKMSRNMPKLAIHPLTRGL